MFSRLQSHFAGALAVSAILCFDSGLQAAYPPPAGTENQPAVVLAPLDVNASRATALTVPSLTAARTELALSPGGTEVVDSERYLRGRASTVADTFALSPGVFAQSRFGSDEARLSIRGSGLQRTFHGRGLRVLQDGVPINLADGGFDMQTLEPTSASYINVWRGGNALAYGGSTLGGAIDYVSRTGRTSPGGVARVELGSHGYLRATVAGGVTSAPADAYASFTQQQQEGFRDHAEQNNQRLLTNFGWLFTDTIESRLYLTAVRSGSELPGNLTKAQLEADPHQANPGNLTLDQMRDYDLLRLASKTTARHGDTTTDFIAAWTYKNLDHPIFQVIDQLSNDTLLGLTVRNTTGLLGRDHLLRAGLLLNHGETAAANYTNVLGQRGALLTRDVQRATNLEAYAESQLVLFSGFTSVLGANLSHNRRETTRTRGAITAANTYDRSYDQLSPKLGLRWDNPARDLQLFANVSGSYEPPSFSESGTVALANQAQTATTVEVGTRGVRHWFRWDATLYTAAVRDELLTVDTDGNPLTPAATINADRTTHRGAELALEADLLGSAWNAPATPAHRLVARAAWTYGDFEFDRYATPLFNYAGKTIAGQPPHLLRGELHWENASGYYAGPTFEWVPESAYIDHRNTFSSEPYALLGFKFGRRTAKGYSWFIEIKNLTDETYAATTGVIENASGLDSAQFLPGEGRSLFAGLDYRF